MFIKTIRDAKLLSKKEMSILFINWKELIVTNNKLLMSLRIRQRQSMEQQQSSIGDILCENVIDKMNLYCLLWPRKCFIFTFFWATPYYLINRRATSEIFRTKYFYFSRISQRIPLLHICKSLTNFTFFSFLEWQLTSGSEMRDISQILGIVDRWQWSVSSLLHWAN